MSVTSFDKLKNKDYCIVIPSHQRAGHIEEVQKVFPNAVMYIHESELPDYEKTCRLPIILHNKVDGYGSVLNGIFDGCKKAGIRYCAVFDDDVERFSTHVGNRDRYFNAEQTEQAIVNGCQVLEDLNAGIYLFSTVGSIIRYNQAEPFKVGFSLPQGAAIFRCDMMGRFVEKMHHYEDFDFCMEYLLKHRYIVIDNRLQANADARYNEGGCNSFRSGENEKKCREYIEKKWKSHVKFVISPTSGIVRPSCTVQRKQK